MPVTLPQSVLPGSIRREPVPRPDPSRTPLGEFPSPAGGGTTLRSELLTRIDEVERIAVADRNYRVNLPVPMFSVAESSVTALIVLRPFTVQFPDIPEAVGYAETTIGNLDYNTTYHVYFHDNDRDGRPDSCIFATRNAEEVMVAPGVIFVGTIKTLPSESALATVGEPGGSGPPPPDPSEPIGGPPGHPPILE